MPRVPQLVGQSCAICGRRIGSILDAHFCPACGRPVHPACTESVSTIPPDGCPVCRSAPPVVPEPTPTTDEEESAEPDGWQSRWADYRFRRLVCLLTIVGVLPTTLLSFQVERLLGLSGVGHLAVGGVVVVWFHLIMTWGCSFPCPRCGEAFGRNFWNRNPFARRCVHCKLRVGEPGPPATDG